MRRNPVSFALTAGMALIVVFFGFILLSAAGLAGFAAVDALVAQRSLNDPGAPEGPQLSKPPAAAPTPPLPRLRSPVLKPTK